MAGIDVIASSSFARSDVSMFHWNKRLSWSEELCWSNVCTDGATFTQAVIIMKTSVEARS